MIDEIIGGLKNAVERGEPLEEAVQSFINAGYNPVEVKEVARTLALGATLIINPPAKQEEKPSSSSTAKAATKAADSAPSPSAQTQVPQARSPTPSTPLQATSSSSLQITKGGILGAQPSPSKRKIIFLVIVLIILLLGIAGVLFKEEIAGFIGNG